MDASEMAKKRWEIADPEKAHAARVKGGKAAGLIRSEKKAVAARANLEKARATRALKLAALKQQDSKNQSMTGHCQSCYCSFPVRCNCACEDCVSTRRIFPIRCGDYKPAHPSHPNSVCLNCDQMHLGQ